jgi:hypothetical protein
VPPCDNEDQDDHLATADGLVVSRDGPIVEEAPNQICFSLFLFEAADERKVPASRGTHFPVPRDAEIAASECQAGTFLYDRIKREWERQRSKHVQRDGAGVVNMTSSSSLLPPSCQSEKSNLDLAPRQLRSLLSALLSACYRRGFLRSALT